TGKAIWVDLDNDGSLDLLISGYTGSNYLTKVYHNNWVNPNSPPAAPANLSSTVTNNGAILSWSAPTDANQSGGLSYNLQIGTAPGQADVMPSMADFATGRRLITRRGNASLKTSWPLTNLVPNTYYWKVQGIDNSYAGSPFSTNGSFTITAAL